MQYDPKEIIELSKGVAENDPITIAKAVRLFKITLEQIDRTNLETKQQTGNKLTDCHFKKMNLLKRNLRVQLAKIAANKKLLSTGSKIPANENYRLRSIAADGTFFAENTETKVVGFIDPLTEPFIEYLQERL